MSSQDLVIAPSILDSPHNLTKATLNTTGEVVELVEPIKVDRLSSLPSELLLLVFELLCTTYPPLQFWVHRSAKRPLSRCLRHFQRINLYFEVKINTVKRLTSLCASLLDSQSGYLIETLHIKLTSWEMHSVEESVITEALVRLAELVPDKFTDTLYSYAIEVIYEDFIKSRLDDHLEELGEDYFDDELEQWIDETTWDLVAMVYEYDTEQLVCSLVRNELKRSREDGDHISHEEAELRVHDAIEKVEEDRRNSAKAIIKAGRADEDLMSALKAQVVKDDTEMFKGTLVEAERDTTRWIIENDEGEELREEVTSLADERFFGSSS